jgi:ABC-type branched-subunit amino acid transport system ATPase component
MLLVDNVSLSFRGSRALDGVSLSIGSGEMVGIVGPNGSGKSTLFNVISGIYRADAGDVRLEGKAIAFKVRPRSSAADWHARSRTSACSAT